MLIPQRTEEIEEALDIITEECGYYSFAQNALNIVIEYLEECESYIQNYRSRDRRK